MKFLVLLLVLFSSRLWSAPYIGVIGKYHAKAEMEFFMEWASRDMPWPSNVYILIEFTNKLPHTLAGYTLYEENKIQEDTIRQFMIRLDASQHVHIVRRTLAHELIHVRQIIEGRLIMHSKHAVTWNDHRYRRPYWKPHDTRPWEDEAIGLSTDLVADFRRKNF